MMEIWENSIHEMTQNSIILGINSLNPIEDSRSKLSMACGREVPKFRRRRMRELKE